DYIFVESTRIFLESKGYEVLSSFDGQDGFKKAKVESPDLILLDMVMADPSDGLETAKAFSRDAAVKDIPVIALTSLEKDSVVPVDLKPHAENFPVKDVVQKPVLPDVLLKTIKPFIEETGMKHRKVVSEINEIVEKWKGKEGNLIMILHQIQNKYGYVPRKVAFELSRILDVPLARIYEVITFYNYFKLDPPGKHTISVCMGTACYLKGAPQLLQELKNVLRIEEGQTTADGLFHLQAVRCLGCCGLAPVIMIDQKVYGKLNSKDVVNILAEYQ
ncbi:MAG TPA: NAD(P)H-dependent oxidoreductase subunit E, partial [Candidatus Omnitrophota bacterium]|nr:NAD(P)H-dependent oxidoreductase subunit E [Candidatus Omnitrophota bacterium]